MPYSDASKEEIEQAIAAYTRDMRAYTMRLWSEVRKKTEQQKGSQGEGKQAAEKQKGEGSDRGRQKG